MNNLNQTYINADINNSNLQESDNNTLEDSGNFMVPEQSLKDIARKNSKIKRVKKFPQKMTKIGTLMTNKKQKFFFINNERRNTKFDSLVDTQQVFQNIKPIAAPLAIERNIRKTAVSPNPHIINRVGAFSP